MRFFPLFASFARSLRTQRAGDSQSLAPPQAAGIAHELRVCVRVCVRRSRASIGRNPPPALANMGRGVPFGTQGTPLTLPR